MGEKNLLFERYDEKMAYADGYLEADEDCPEGGKHEPDPMVPTLTSFPERPTCHKCGRLYTQGVLYIPESPVK
jgi:hypothetical protein